MRPSPCGTVGDHAATTSTGGSAAVVGGVGSLTGDTGFPGGGGAPLAAPPAGE